MENMAFSNDSNNFYDCPNYGSGLLDCAKFMEITGIVILLIFFVN